MNKVGTIFFDFMTFKRKWDEVYKKIKLISEVFDIITK
ncbi:hypothetical protein SC09_contig4orf01214 [Bacillus subtilis]|uniref:Uncharacterized protein n=1 Tax=Bacillus subtilis TaxID=1423 RepID=A0A0D1KCJ0_BACIU|nr:hypothetical protein SC09_contig4orf01214 [Bacillus subtilis]